MDFTLGPLKHTSLTTETSVLKNDREKQWKAIFLVNKCLFTYGHNLCSYVIWIINFERIKFGAVEVEQKPHKPHHWDKCFKEGQGKAVVGYLSS